ncbi:MAG: hypothetical protein OSA10_09715 [Paracoccaceae bacterium]|nr:hypothetical protein [Paracoccaceae bacterium]
MNRITQSIHRLLIMTNWLVIGGYGVFAFLNPDTTGIGFLSFFVAGCIHMLVNWVFKK